MCQSGGREGRSIIPLRTLRTLLRTQFHWAPPLDLLPPSRPFTPPPAKTINRLESATFSLFEKRTRLSKIKIKPFLVLHNLSTQFFDSNDRWKHYNDAVSIVMIEKDTYPFSRFLATKKSLTDVLSRQKNINTVFHLFLGHWPDVGITVREGRNNFPLRSLFGGVPGRYARYMEQVH